MNKSVPLAAAGFAVLAISGSALLGATTATAADGGKASLPHLAAKKAQVTACSGGNTISMSSRAMDVQSIAANATDEIEGSQWTVKGPKKGTDTVLVTLSALTFNGTGGVGVVTFYKDGVGTPEGQKYFGYEDSPATVQFCGKVTKGQHTFSLKLQASGSGASLYNPTITYQRFN